MHPTVVRIGVVLLSFSLVNCASFKSNNTFFKGRDSAYLSAQSIPPLNIPPGYSSSSFESNYPVSDKNYSPEVTKVDITPPGLE